MAIGATLLTCLRDLRAETNQSLNVAHHTQSHDSEVYWLNRQQRELANQYDWPHLLSTVDKPLLSGTVVYDYPEEMAFEQINHLWVKDLNNPTGTYLPLTYGIDEALLVQDEGASVSTWPPRKWQNLIKRTLSTGGQHPAIDPLGRLVIYPPPNRNGILRFAGTYKVPDMVADTDICYLDSTLIVLFAAAEILAGQKSEGATTKLQKANQYLRRLLANTGATKRRMFLLGQGDPGGREQAQPWIDYIPTSP